MPRLPSLLLIISTLIASWLGMQAVHEWGHVLGASVSGGTVARVVLHPLTISRTDLETNPHPLLVVWAGPVWGVLFPILLWGVGILGRLPGTFVLRFFAGFCLLANGLYISMGSFDGVGDCGVMLRQGSQPWQLWLFGIVTAPSGLYIWHGQGKHFGLGIAKEQVDWKVAWGCLVVVLGLVVLGFVTGGE